MLRSVGNIVIFRTQILLTFTLPEHEKAQGPLRWQMPTKLTEALSLLRLAEQTSIFSDYKTQKCVTLALQQVMGDDRLSI